MYAKAKSQTYLPFFFKQTYLAYSVWSALAPKFNNHYKPTLMQMPIKKYSCTQNTWAMTDTSLLLALCLSVSKKPIFSEICLNMVFTVSVLLLVFTPPFSRHI